MKVNNGVSVIWFLWGKVTQGENFLLRGGKLFQGKGRKYPGNDEIPKDSILIEFSLNNWEISQTPFFPNPPNKEREKHVGKFIAFNYAGKKNDFPGKFIVK